MEREGDDLELAKRRYWIKVLRVTVALLLSWLTVTFVGSWFAGDLDTLRLGHFPLGFWMASQGALLSYVLIIAVYAWIMDRLDGDCVANQRSSDSDA